MPRDYVALDLETTGLDTERDAIIEIGAVRFDLDGLLLALDQVHHELRGSEKVFLTGYAGGGNLTWAMTFAHPERLAAVAPVSG